MNGPILRRPPRGLPETAPARRTPIRRFRACATIPMPAAAPGEVVTRTIWLSIDPYMRGRLREEQTYAVAIQIGEVMTGETVGRGHRLAASRLRRRRHRRGRARLADATSGDAGRSAGEAEEGRGAAVGLSRRPGHAGATAYRRRDRDLQAEDGRDVRRLRRLRRGRVGRRAAGETGRCARGRHRRRGGEMPLGAGQPRLRRLRRSPLAGPAAGAAGGLPERHRLLFRECRRCGAGGGVRPAQPVRPRGDVRDGVAV